MIIGSRGASMIRAITVAALCTLSPFAHAQEITGEWAGRYICNQGVTQLHLTIQKTGAGKGITATFNFGPPPENPDVPKGAYAMRGTYDPATRRMKLEGERRLGAGVGASQCPSPWRTARRSYQPFVKRMSAVASIRARSML